MTLRYQRARGDDNDLPPVLRRRCRVRRRAGSFFCWRCRTCGRIASRSLECRHLREHPSSVKRVPDAHLHTVLL